MGGQHSPASEGVGGPYSDDWRESPALCVLSLHIPNLFMDICRMQPLIWTSIQNRINTLYTETIFTAQGHSFLLCQGVMPGPR
jgi:hypothetical protein